MAHCLISIHSALPLYVTMCLLRCRERSLGQIFLLLLKYSHVSLTVEDIEEKKVVANSFHNIHVNTV